MKSEQIADLSPVHSNSDEKVASSDEKAVSADIANADNSNNFLNLLKPDLSNHKTPKKAQVILDEALGFCQASQDYWQEGDFENAVEALDQAYLLILSVTPDDTNNITQQKEDLRFMISKRILEIYASRNIVLSGNHTAVPLTMNKHVEREIKKFTEGNEKKFFIASYKRSGRHRPQILKALKQAGLPEELSWLPLIESGFKVNALSKARALGLWQFIPSTGYRYGLKRNALIDERLDPIKATNAAIDYLRELHNIFGDWNTVLAGYNCGEGRVLRVIRNQNVNYLDDFWDLYDRLPHETARYVPRFIATLYIVSNPEKYGLNSVIVDPPMEYQTVIISKKISINNIAKAIDVPARKLIALNSELRYKILPGVKYSLRLPPGKGEILLSKIDEIPLSSPPKRAFFYHKIRYGESLSTIAKKYHTNVARIARANNIYKKNKIVAGKTIKIPQKGTVLLRPKSRIIPKYGKATTHKVKRGDSLWIIARSYGTSTKKIYEVNNLTNSMLSIGQILRIPDRRVKKTIPDGIRTYKVKTGDSPFTIAKKYNMVLENFLRLNKLTPRSKIYPKQILYIE